MNIAIDPQGYLLNFNDWNQAIAQYLAEKEGLKKLQSEHWLILEKVREFYQEYERMPSIRVLIHLLEKSIAKEIPSTYLYKLFPFQTEFLAKLAKVAGLPKPKHCI